MHARPFARPFARSMPATSPASSPTVYFAGVLLFLGKGTNLQGMACVVGIVIYALLSTQFQPYLDPVRFVVIQSWARFVALSYCHKFIYFLTACLAAVRRHLVEHGHVGAFAGRVSGTARPELSAITTRVMPLMADVACRCCFVWCALLLRGGCHHFIVYSDPPIFVRF